MAANATALNDDQKRTMAVYLAGRPFGDPSVGDARNMPNRCGGGSAAVATTSGDWNGWGADPGNSRYQGSGACSVCARAVTARASTAPTIRNFSMGGCLGRILGEFGILLCTPIGRLSGVDNGP
jgi:hypothetical protein